MGVLFQKKQNQISNLNHGDKIRTALAVVRTLEAIRRSHLAEMRTGVGILTIALSILTIMITTSSFYSFFDVLPLTIPLMAIDAALILLGSYLIFKGLRGIRQTDQKLQTIQFEKDDIDAISQQIFDNG